MTVRTDVPGMTTCDSTAGDTERALVRFNAEFGGQPTSLDLGVKPGVALRKAFLLWCREHRIMLSAVRFLSQDGRELTGDLTASLLGWRCTEDTPSAIPSASVTVSPRRGRESQWPASRPAPGASGAQETDWGEGTDAAGLLKLVPVAMVARAPDAHSVIRFRVGPSTQLRRLMSQWCKLHKLLESDVQFLLNDQELLPSDTLAEWGCTGGGDCAGQVVEIHVEPVDASSEPPLPAPTDGVAATRGQMAASSIAGKPPPASTPKSKPVTQTPAKQTFAAGLATVASVAPKASPRIQVRVEAEGALLQRVEAGKAANPSQATLSFWTKKTASVWKVMFAWAKHYQLTVDQVLFTVDGKELMKNETPESRGWQPGQLVIFSAVLRQGSTAACSDELRTSALRSQRTSSGNIAAGITVDSKAVPVTVPSESKPVVEGATPDRISVKVRAEGADTTVDFKMKRFTPFGKMMTSWCGHHKVKVSEINFLLNGLRLRAEDTPNSCTPPIVEGDVIHIIAASTTEAGAGACVEAAFAVPARTRAVGSTCEAVDVDCAAGALDAKAADSIAADAQKAPTEATQDARINVVVVAAGDKVDPVEFRMRPSATFQKLMQSWCDKNNLQRETVVFELDGRVLQPDDRPSGAGPLTIQATMLSASVVHGRSVEDVGAKLDAKAASTPPSEGNSATGDRIVVEVVAQNLEGTHVVEFTMRPRMTFEKMMTAWCKTQNLEPDAARFLFGSRELKPDDTPDTCGWLGRGSLLIHAEPREATKTTRLDSEKDDDDATERVSVQVVADDVDGQNCVDFKMKPDTEFMKLMEAWCEHHGLPREEARFCLDGKEIQPHDSPQTCGWRGTGKLVLQAIPRGAEPAIVVEDETEVTQSIMVIIHSPLGKPMDFTLQLTSSFEVIAKAWCEAHKVSPEALRLSVKGRDLSFVDTPETCGWSCSQGPLEVDAVMNLTSEAASAEAVPTRGQTALEHATAKSAPHVAPTEQLPVAQGTSKTSQNVALEEGSDPSTTRLAVQVVADASDGRSVIDFMMRLTTPLEKMMAAWCERFGMPINAATFMLGERVLRPEDTLLALGLSKPSTDAVVIHAVPGEDGKPTLPGTPQAEEGGAEVSTSEQALHDPKQPAPLSVGISGVEPTPQAGPAAATAGNLSEEVFNQKIQVQVVAEGSDGVNVIDFAMRLGTPFRKVMTAWCQHHNLSTEAAVFSLDSGGLEELQPDDTPASCGWTPNHGVLVLRATPCDVGGTEGSSLEPLASPTVEGNTDDRRDPPTSTSVLGSDAPPAAPTQSDASSSMAGASGNEKDKVSVQVVAEGAGETSVIDFKMKLTTAFSKMMTAWCGHNEIPLAEAVFLHNGKALRPEDTPTDCGWSVDKGILTVHALPAGSVQTSPPSQHDVATATSHGGGRGGRGRTRGRGRTSPSADVQDVAVPENLAPVAHPASPEQTSVDSSSVPPASQAETSKAGSHPSSDIGNLQRQKSKVASTVGEKIEVQVLAEGADGTNVTNVKMRLTTPFEKMMDAWCQQYDIPIEEAQFELHGRILQPSDSPSSCGWSAAKGVLEIRAQPKPDTHNIDDPDVSRMPASEQGVSGTSVPTIVAEQPAVRESSASVEPTAKPEASPVLKVHGGEKPNQGSSEVLPEVRDIGPAAAGPSPWLPRIDPSSDKSGAEVQTGTVEVKVVAEGQNGTNVLTFKIKLGVPLSRMMGRWSKHHGIEEGQAAFLLGERELSPTDTPASLGWEITKDGAEAVTLHAVPKESTAGKGQKRKRDTKPSGEPAVKRAASALQMFMRQRRPELQQSQPGLKAPEQQRIMAAEFKALSDEERKPFEEEAVNERRALEEAKQQGAKAGGATSSSALAADSSSGVRAQEVASASPTLPVDRSISVVVVAQGSDGLSELRFKMRTSTPFAKMMKAWCENHEIPVGEATFIADKRALLPTDSAEVLQLKAEGEVTVMAVPRDSAEAEEAVRFTEAEREAMKAREKAKEDVERAQLPEVQGAGSALSAHPGAEPKPAPPSPPPKKPLPAYILFVRSRRPRLLEERADMRGQVAAQMKCLSEEWKELEASSRKGFEEEAAELRRRYEADMREYHERHPDLKGKPQIPKPSGKAAVRRPKRKTSADNNDSSSCNSGAVDSSDAEKAPTRRSTRIREAPPVASIRNSGHVTIVHHQPPSNTRRRKGHTDEARADALLGEEPKNMSFKEYLNYDRVQELDRDEARELRAKLSSINGGVDQEMQLAMALSLSMSKEGIAGELLADNDTRCEEQDQTDG